MEILKKEEMAVYRLRALYESYGYTQFKMSKFEEYDLYVGNKSFLVSDHIITFTDTNGKLMALKPDVTLSIVKNHNGGTQKVHYNENVYRVSGTEGSYKEIMQVGLECVGDVDDYSISEVLTLASESLREITPKFVLDVSHLGIVAELVDSMDLSAGAKAQILQCVGEKNLHGAAAAAEGAAQEKIDALLALMGLYGPAQQVLPQLKALLGGTSAVEELERVLSAVPQEKLNIDFSVVQDMNYYNGIVFKGFVEGVPFGILSGGQYDRLMEKLGKKSKAIGFAVYMDLLEDLTEDAPEYDVDTVVVYTESADLAKVAQTVKELAAQGKSARACKTVPEKLHYREMLKVEG